MARILIVEDDGRIARPLAREMRREMHSYDLAEDGEAGWSFLESGSYDLVLLDVMLPRLNGIELCKRMRARGMDTPVLMLTALDSMQDKVGGLDSGADDFLVKPFNLEELHARIRALLRRAGSKSPVLSWGNVLSLDPVAKVVSARGRSLELRPREYQLLETLLRKPGHFFSAEEFLDKLWGWDSPGKGTVKTHMKGLRDKLKAVELGHIIETQYGRGYRLSAEGSAM